MPSTDEEVQRKARWGTNFLNSDDWGDGGVEYPRLAMKAAALSEGLALEADPHLCCLPPVFRLSLDAWSRADAQ